MTPTTGYATKDELYAVKHDLSQRIADVELNLSLQIGKVQSNVDALREEMGERLTRMEQNSMSLFAALFAHLGIDTPPLQ